MAATRTPARFLLGEAGIGKSTALRGSAEKHAGPVFRVACQRIAIEIPFDPLFALLQNVTRQTLPGTTVSRTSVRDAVLELQFALERSTMNATPLVQIDDLHWADDASLNAVPYLVERLQDFPVRWEFAARTGYDPVWAVYHRLRQAGLAEDATLHPLPEQVIEAIVASQGGDLGREQRVAIVAQSGGNPLYAQLLVRAYSSVPSGIVHAARDHVADLPADALTVAAALAVVEEPLERNLLPEMTSLSPRAVTDALNVLLGRALVEVRDHRLSVRHHLLADAILSEAPPEVAARVHAAAALIASDDETRARHLLAAGRSSEARVAFTRLGWRALEDEDWDIAARCFAEALALEVSATAPPLEHTASVAAALRLARRIAGSEEHYAIEPEDPNVWSQLSADVRARLELVRLTAFMFDSPSFDAPERARLADIAGGDIEPEIASELYYYCIRAAHHHLEDDVAKALIEKLRALVPSLTSMPPRIKALARCGMYAAIYGDWERGIGEFEDAIRSGAAAGAYDVVLDVAWPAIGAIMSLGRTQEALAFGRFAHALPGGMLRKRTALIRTYALALQDAGRSKEALSLMSTAAAAVPSLRPRERDLFRAHQISLASQLGLVEHARSLIDECPDIENTHGLLQLAIAHFHEEYGDREAARAAFEADFDSPLRAHAANLRYTLLALARIALQTADPALMQRTQRRLQKLRGTGGVNDACVAWGEGYKLLLEGRPVAAISQFQRAISAPLAAIEIAKLRLEIAKVTGRLDDFVKAIDGFKAIDLDHMVDRATEIANGMGVRIHKRRRQSNGALELTERQRTIALMISSGKTNAEIAAALFITKRTAEHHVDHIRNKLGVRSRLEIAVAVANGAAFR